MYIFLFQSTCCAPPCCYWLLAWLWPLPGPASSRCPATWSTTSTNWTPLGRSVAYKFSTFIRNTPSGWHDLFLFTLQAGHNFHNVDYSYIKNLCGTMLKGPKLPVKWVTLASWVSYWCAHLSALCFCAAHLHLATSCTGTVPFGLGLSCWSWAKFSGCL